ncbi:MAG: toxin [Anaerolineales bacterium]|nr:toxin [Anaerolineales bacterium]
MHSTEFNPTRKDVEKFLQDFKETVITGTGLIVRKNPKNFQALAELGITVKQREEILLNLSVDDYSSGPLEDRDYPGDVWIFGTKIDRLETYIKLKLETRRGVDFARCYSFHPAEFKMNYPFRQSEEN